MTYKPHECLVKPKQSLVTYLVHSEWMDDFAPIVRELGRFLWRDDRDQPRGGHLPRIRGENAIDLFPNLQLGGPQASGEECSKEVGITTTNLSEKGARNRAKEA